jgi:AcrR family transcriptional regulator
MPHSETTSVSDEPSVFLPKQERSSRTQAAILQAAREMIAEGGVESLTISGVAARVGLTTGAFYARFRNKDALLHALFEQTLAANQDAIDAFRVAMTTDLAPLAEIVANFVPGAMALIRDNSALFRLFGYDHRGSRGERDRAIRILEAVIEPMQELLRERSEELPHPDPELAGAMLIVMMQGIVDWALLLRESSNPVVPIRDAELGLEIVRASLGYLGLPTIDNTTDDTTDDTTHKTTADRTNNPQENLS